MGTAASSTIADITNIVDCVLFGITCFFGVMALIKSTKMQNKWVLIFLICVTGFTGYACFGNLIAIFGKTWSGFFVGPFNISYSLTWWLLTYLYSSCYLKKVNDSGK